MCCTRLAENTRPKIAKITQKLPSAHHRTRLSDYIFATKAFINNRKNYSWKLLPVPLTEFCRVQNSLCVQVLRSPILAALLHGTRAVGVSQTLRRGTKNGITELSLLVISNRGRHLFPRAAITLGPHSSVGLCYAQDQIRENTLAVTVMNAIKMTRTNRLSRTPTVPMMM